MWPALQPPTSGSVTAPPIVASTATRRVVDAGEGGAVVGAGAAVEGVAVAGLAADHQVGAGAAVHRRRAGVFSRVEDVDPVEDVVAAAAFERVGVVVFARVEDVVAGPPTSLSEPVPPSRRRADRVRDALADRQFVVAGAERRLRSRRPCRCR